MTELLQSIRADLLSRRLLPALIALGLALIAAVAYAATGGGASSTPIPPASTPTATVPGIASALPVRIAPANPNMAVSETPGGTRYQSRGATRNPFTPLPSPPAKKAAASTSSSSKGAAGKSGGTGTSKSGAGETTSGSSKPQPAPAKPAPKPMHTGLTSTQSYGVTLSLTTFAGGLDTIDPLERLSLVPSAQQPLLVYLGVLKGGRDALFAVQPGTVVSGPGSCTPGPTDCEILSLAQDQIESLAASTGSGTANVALFAVTAIKVGKHASVAHANRARREASAAGRALLDASTLPALPLFEYQPDVGAVVDLRNLAVGGEK
jgi:hypothetical protein